MAEENFGRFRPISALKRAKKILGVICDEKYLGFVVDKFGCFGVGTKPTPLISFVTGVAAPIAVNRTQVDSLDCLDLPKQYVKC